MMKRSGLLEMFENLEKLIGKLPGTLRNPVLKEVTPVKELFLLQRPPRFLILGDRAADLTALWAALGGKPPRSILREVSSEPGWEQVRFPNGGQLEFVDLRGETTIPVVEGSTPDIILFLTTESTPSEELERSLDEVDHHLAAAGPTREGVPQPSLLALLLARAPEPPSLPGVDGVPAAGPPVPHGQARESLRRGLQYQVEKAPLRRSRLARTLIVDPFVRFSRDGEIDPERDERVNIDVLGAVLARELPNEARLEFARLTSNREAQHEIASTLIRSVSGLCGVIGTQPIPLADLPVLTSLQVAMVSGVIYISGRKAGVRVATEFLGAMGANIGLAFFLREASRNVIKLVPFWGHMVSGVIAGTATYGIGRAATAYFIDEKGLNEARRIFRKIKRRKEPLPGRDPVQALPEE